jgi:hypothetical protein
MCAKKEHVGKQEKTILFLDTSIPFSARQCCPHSWTDEALLSI